MMKNSETSSSLKLETHDIFISNESKDIFGQIILEFSDHYNSLTIQKIKTGWIVRLEGSCLQASEQKTEQQKLCENAERLQVALMKEF